MKYILDTHTFIWAFDKPEELSTAAKNTLLKNGGNLYLSAASVWEMAIKICNNKLTLSLPLKSFVDTACKDLQCKILPIMIPHIMIVESLPLHHKEPFDRLIIAQSITTKYKILSKDEWFESYGVQNIW